MTETQRPEGGDSAPQGEPTMEQSAEELKVQLEEALREKEQFRGIAQRAQADLANYRKRVEEEREELQRRVTGQIIAKLLDTVDDFERALAHVPPEDSQESWAQGIALIYQKVWALLEQEGVTRVEAYNQPFDPWEHEALFHEETDSFPEGQVMQVIRPGYKLKDKVLRPAQVAVARRVAGSGANNSAGQDQEGR